MAVYEPPTDHDDWIRNEDFKDLMGQLNVLTKKLEEDQVTIDDLKFVIDLIKDRERVRIMFDVLTKFR